MNKSLSNLIVKTLQSNIKADIIGKKINNKWKWSNRKEIYNLVVNCTVTLEDLNIRKGDRVAYKGKNSIEWLCWNTAVNSKGAIWVPMYSDQNIEYCQHIVNDCKPKILITDNYSLANEINVPVIDHLIPNFETNSEIDFEYNEISSLIYTSGTTGKPKGVMLSNENILSNVNGIRNIFKDIRPTTSLNILPWAHIYTQTCELYYNILYDNKIALSSGKENFINECKEIRPEVIYIVPRVLEMVKSKLDFLDKPLIRKVLPLLISKLFGGNLITIFTGGAKLDKNTRNFFLDNGISICEGYGCTETSPMVSVNHITNPRNEESVGFLLDKVLIEIINEEICVSGPNIMKGYWGNEKATNEALIKKDDKIFYKTGDKGYIEKNFLFYEGRIKENYKLSNGKFVNVLEVEEKIKDCVKGNFIIFGENMEYNSIISDTIIDEKTYNKINNKLDKYLRIDKVYMIKPKEMSQFMTPKMSIKRKPLTDYIYQKYINKF